MTPVHAVLFYDHGSQHKVGCGLALRNTPHWVNVLSQTGRVTCNNCLRSKMVKEYGSHR